MAKCGTKPSPSARLLSVFLHFLYFCLFFLHFFCVLRTTGFPFHIPSLFLIFTPATTAFYPRYRVDSPELSRQRDSNTLVVTAPGAAHLSARFSPSLAAQWCIALQHAFIHSYICMRNNPGRFNYGAYRRLGHGYGQRKTPFRMPGAARCTQGGTSSSPREVETLRRGTIRIPSGRPSQPQRSPSERWRRGEGGSLPFHLE